ncbi:MAG TPA: hypothetical protein VFS43_37895 [Polyangiaceae bacterium]|nr:hypothetical protein [Polyangiaceae bacterium]
MHLPVCLRGFDLPDAWRRPHFAPGRFAVRARERFAVRARGRVERGRVERGRVERRAAGAAERKEAV